MFLAMKLTVALLVAIGLLAAFSDVDAKKKGKHRKGKGKGKGKEKSK